MIDHLLDFTNISYTLVTMIEELRVALFCFSKYKSQLQLKQAYTRRVNILTNIYFVTE